MTQRAQRAALVDEAAAIDEIPASLYEQARRKLLQNEPLRDEANFRKVTVSPHGVPQWVDDDFDLSPGALRAWCEMGKVVSLDETDKWIDAHCAAPQRVA